MSINSKKSQTYTNDLRNHHIKIISIATELEKVFFCFVLFLTRMTIAIQWGQGASRRNE